MEKKTIEKQILSFKKSTAVASIRRRKKKIVSQMWEEDFDVDEVRLILLVNAILQLKKEAKK